MKRTLVISDIHGEMRTFEALLDQVQYTPKKDQLILLGDYVDRGSDSSGVLNKVMALREQGAIVLRGNHEDMMISAAQNDQDAWQKWWKCGALNTLRSYDATIEDQRLPDSEMFKEHVSFLNSLDYYYEIDHYIFVHAGVDPEKPIHETDPYILTWIRDDFFDYYQGKKVVIFGHTRTSRLYNDPENHDVYFGSNHIIGIDGGAVYGGQLNCLDITNRKVYSIKTER